MAAREFDGLITSLQEFLMDGYSFEEYEELKEVAE